MKRICFLVIWLLISVACYGMTASDLASHLGVEFWETQVDLPKGSYSIELYEIKNGAFGQRLTVDEKLPKDHDNKIIVMIREKEEGRGSIVTLKVGNFSYGATSHNPAAENGLLFVNSIPASIGVGEYPLMGIIGDVGAEKKGAAWKNMANYLSGFVLKVSSKN